MDSNQKIGAIVNLRAAGGLTGKRWPEIAAQIERRLGRVEARYTESPGAGIALARAFLEENFDCVIAVGGDGTVHEVANGFLATDPARRANAQLGVLPLGTGGDLRRTLGLPTGIAEAVDVIATGTALEMDAGKIIFTSHAGEPAERYFVNLVSFGMGGEVAAHAARAPKAFGGTAAYFWATAAVALRYRGKRVRLELDGQASNHTILNIAVGNGRYQGGGMHPCPRALPNDGVFDVTVIDHMNLAALARDVHYLYSEEVYRCAKVHPFRAKSVRAQSEEVVAIEIDGEPLGRLPLEISILPRALRVIVPAGSPLMGARPSAASSETR